MYEQNSTTGLRMRLIDIRDELLHCETFPESQRSDEVKAAIEELRQEEANIEDEINRRFDLVIAKRQARISEFYRHDMDSPQSL